MVSTPWIGAFAVYVNFLLKLILTERFVEAEKVFFSAKLSTIFFREYDAIKKCPSFEIFCKLSSFFQTPTSH